MTAILIGIDLSASDKIVLENATELATAMQAKTHLLHVVPPETPNLAFGEYIKPPSAAERKQILDEIRKKIDAVASELRPHFQEQDFQADLVEQACTAKALLGYAKEHSCDTIVIGTHSRNLVERMILGSTAEKVIRKSSIPVIVVPTMV